MAGGASCGGAAEITLEHTPTWIVASVCSVIVLISLLFERLLQRLGKRLTKGRRKPLYEALLKLKQELMLLGFISLLLTVFQGATQKICVRESLMHHLLPCPRAGAGATKVARHFAATVFTGVVGSTRRLLAGGGAASDYCLNKGKVPILSIQAIHQLHIFIFVLAATHVVLSAVTVILGITQTRKWKHWEDKIQQSNDIGPLMIRHVQEFEFIKNHFRGHGKRWEIFGWLLLLLVGSKLEHIITELAIDVAQKHTAIDGELVVALSDDLFWFHRPKLVLLLIHIILFQNAFEIAFFFWLLVTYGFKSCIMGKPTYAIARLMISVISQLLCGYSTLPLYALISQMGSSFKKAMFDESVSEGLANWAQKARKRNRMPAASVGDNSPVGEGIQMTNARRESAIEQGTARLI
ncbi:hypothetical protein ACQJBY_072352 [Aegilops geniculata]